MVGAVAWLYLLARAGRPLADTRPRLESTTPLSLGLVVLALQLPGITLAHPSSTFMLAAFGWPSPGRHGRTGAVRSATISRDDGRCSCCWWQPPGSAWPGCCWRRRVRPQPGSRPAWPMPVGDSSRGHSPTADGRRRPDCVGVDRGRGGAAAAPAGRAADRRLRLRGLPAGAGWTDGIDLPTGRRPALQRQRADFGFRRDSRSAAAGDRRTVDAVEGAIRSGLCGSVCREQVGRAHSDRPGGSCCAPPGSGGPAAGLRPCQPMPCARRRRKLVVLADTYAPDESRRVSTSSSRTARTWCRQGRR